MLPTPGAGEILLILLLVFIVFFGEKVGALGDAIGKAREEFRRGKRADDRIDVRRVESPPRAETPRQAESEAVRDENSASPTDEG